MTKSNVESIEGLASDRQEELFRAVKKTIQDELHTMAKNLGQEHVDLHGMEFTFKRFVDVVFKANLGKTPLEIYATGVMAAYILKEFEQRLVTAHPRQQVD